MSQLTELVDIKKTVLTCKYGCEQEDDSVGLHGRRLGLSAIGTSSTLQSSYQAQAKNEKDKIISSQSEQQVSRCLRSTANKLLLKMDIFILIVFCFYTGRPCNWFIRNIKNGFFRYLFLLSKFNKKFKKNRHLKDYFFISNYLRSN